MMKTVRLALKLVLVLALVWVSTPRVIAACTPGSYRYINTFTCCGQGTEYAEMQCNSSGTGYVQTGVYRCFPTSCF